MKITTEKERIIVVETFGFSGGERHVSLSELPEREALGSFVRILATINDSNGLMDLMLVSNALNSHYQEKIPIELTLPYLPYSRQDRVCAPGQAFSLEVMASLLKTMPITKLTTWDCHSQIGIDLTGAMNISAADIIGSSPDLCRLLEQCDVVLISPDKGAIERTKTIKNRFEMKEMITCEKQRDPDNGRISGIHINGDSLKGKHAVIVDDICDGGATFIKIAEELKKKGADEITLYVTHGIFSRGLDVFEGLIETIFTTQSFPQMKNEKLHVIEMEVLQ